MYNHVHELCMYVCNTSLLAHVNSQSALMWSKAVIHIPILLWAVSIGGALCFQQYMKKMTTKKRIKCCMFFFWPQLQICPIFFISKCIIIHLTFLLFFFYCDLMFGSRFIMWHHHNLHRRFISRLLLFIINCSYKFHIF